MIRHGHGGNGGHAGHAGQAGQAGQAWMRGVSAVVLAALILATLPAGAADAAARRSAAKVDPALLAEAKAAPTALFRVIARGTPPRGGSLEPLPVSLAHDDSADEAERALRSAGGELHQALRIVGAAAGSVTGAQVLRLANDGTIDRIVRDDVVVALDEQDGDRAHPAAPAAAVREVNAPAAWKAGLTGTGVGVAVLDSGVAAHPDLAGRVIASVDLTGSDWRVSLTPLGDPGGHGTHVAGLIAGSGVRSEGAYTGVAPGADIISVRVIDANGSARLSTVLHGMQWILANRSTYHIRIANMSFGARARSSYQADLLASAAEMLAFAGIVPVVAAGNRGGDSSTITTPGTDPFVLTVGAVDDRGTVTIRDDRIATWSSRGPTAFDAIAKPDVVAPGRRIVSLRAAGSTLDRLYPDRRVVAADADRPEYFLLSGTSMAAAMVSGAVALLLERHPGISVRQVKAQLRATARPIDDASRFDQGAGLIDARAAIRSRLVDAPLSTYRVSDVFATDLGRLLYGQPIVWRDLRFNGGTDSRGLRWTDISWENITWNDISWENISWESFTWADISWESISWESISWEGISWELIVPTVGTGAGGWVPVD